MKFIGAIKLFTDGGCRGNPGPGAIGVLILDETGRNELFRHAKCIGHTTNNRAEYLALIEGLDLCAKHTRGNVCCFVDSELLVNHLNGVWRLKDDTLRGLYHKVKKREQVFQQVVYQHVKRENPNMRKVDRLVNEAFEGR